MYKRSRQKFSYHNFSYNNNNVHVTVLQHIENPGINRKVYSGIFRHI